MNKRVLFFGEAVSLAHVVRPLVLAEALDAEQYDVHFACDPRYASLARTAPHVSFHPIGSVSAEVFIDAANRGDFGLSDEDLQDYLNQDLALLDALRPDLVVSDFRLTVSVACELRGVTHATITNAHWSPYRVLGFDCNPGRDWAPPTRSASGALNAIRERNGLPLVRGYCDLITRADFTLYPEPPGLIANTDLPRHHAFLGPLLWSPDVPRPAWWETWDEDLPLVYVTLGSTGLAAKLPTVIEALQALPVNILVATAARGSLPAIGQAPNVYCADYLAGDEAARLADVVVCNGGSATAYQALNEGTPVIGLWSNLDQYLTSNVIAKAGAGLSSYAGEVGAETVPHLVRAVLNDESFRRNAERIRGLFRANRAPDRFRAFVGQTIG